MTEKTEPVVNPCATMNAAEILALAEQEDTDIKAKHAKERSELSDRIKAEQDTHAARQKWLKALAKVAPEKTGEAQ